MFDADAWLAAHEPWTLKLAGRVHVARPVSILAIQRFQAGIVSAGDNVDRQRKAIRTVLRVAYPFRVRYWVGGDPVKMVMGLDEAARQAVLADFFGWAANRYRSNASSTTGTGSPPPTVTPLRSPASAPALA